MMNNSVINLHSSSLPNPLFFLLCFYPLLFLYPNRYIAAELGQHDHVIWVPLLFLYPNRYIAVELGRHDHVIWVRHLRFCRLVIVFAGVTSRGAMWSLLYYIVPLVTHSRNCLFGSGDWLG
jgi:hypothetical protein